MTVGQRSGFDSGVGVLVCVDAFALTFLLLVLFLRTEMKLSYDDSSRNTEYSSVYSVLLSKLLHFLAKDGRDDFWSEGSLEGSASMAARQAAEAPGNPEDIAKNQTIQIQMFCQKDITMNCRTTNNSCNTQG